jgi:hypothetical protein
MISQVYIWSNGMVAVFDRDGHQMTHLQGRFGEMAPEISKALNHPDPGDPIVEIFMAQFRGEKIKVPNVESFDRLWKRQEQ